MIRAYVCGMTVLDAELRRFWSRAGTVAHALLSNDDVTIDPDRSKDRDAEEFTPYTPEWFAVMLAGEYRS